MTEAQRKRWLRKLARETDRARLVRARAAVKEARAGKRSARARARRACLKARVHFKRWLARERVQVRQRIAQLRAQLRTETKTRRARVQACCGRAERQRVKASSDAAIAKARAELAQLQRERKRERTWTRADSPRPGLARSPRERRQESDHEVASNLSADEGIVWAKVKAKIKATPRMTRTEAFQHWLHDNSADVARILAADAEQAYQHAVRDEAKQRKLMKRARSPRELRNYVAAELADVPF